MTEVDRIIAKTYGDNGMARALAAAIEDRIWRNDWNSQGREHGIMLMCWDWMTGGTTAQACAREIEAALVAQDAC